jgi:uncharacterized protein
VLDSQETRKVPITVISDGKPGHENQSLGIAEAIPGADILLLRHDLKEGILEAILRARILLTPLNRTTTVLLLKEIFPQNEIMRLLDHHPAAIISAGTLSAGACLLAGRLTRAKTVVCMRPSMIPLYRFDLAVIPAHDNPPRARNVLKTYAAPNRVSPHRLLEESNIWKSELPKNAGNVISWVIGGPSSSAKFDEAWVEKGLVATLEWANANKWQVWLSTARRTPEGLEEKIAELSKTHPALSWHLLWHRDQRNPLYAMFNFSKLAIVTSDSVSMIAEAASAGVGPLIYQASTAPPSAKSKHDRMVDGLAEAGYGARASNDMEVLLSLNKLASGNLKFAVLDDTGKAVERVMALIR